MVAEGEDKTMEGWLVYGAALNEGREMFPSDEQFGQWVRETQLDAHASKDERTAAMWAAANPEDYQATKEANPRVRTVRGLHAKWKDTQETEGKPKKKKDKSKDKPSSNGNSPSKPQGGTPPPPSPPKKARPINNPPYNIQEGMGSIKGIAELYAREYTGTAEDAADILFGQTIKGCEQDSVSMSIARDRVKWFLKWKKVLDLVEPRMHEFLEEEPNLKIVN